VFFAIKDAVRAARIQNLERDDYFEMRLPATSERIRMYSADSIASKAAAYVVGEEMKVELFQPQGTY
jgi:hypothetical protein